MVSLSLSTQIMVKYLKLGDNRFLALSFQFTVHSSPDNAALNIPNCWQRHYINQAHLGERPLGRPRRYGDNIKMDNRELGCENGNSTTLHFAQRTHKFKVVHNMKRIKTEIVIKCHQASNSETHCTVHRNYTHAHV